MGDFFTSCTLVTYHQWYEEEIETYEEKKITSTEQRTHNECCDEAFYIFPPIAILLFPCMIHDCCCVNKYERVHSEEWIKKNNTKTTSGTHALRNERDERYDDVGGKSTADIEKMLNILGFIKFDTTRNVTKENKETKESTNAKRNWTVVKKSMHEVWKFSGQNKEANINKLQADQRHAEAEKLRLEKEREAEYERRERENRARRAQQEAEHQKRMQMQMKVFMACERNILANSAF